MSKKAMKDATTPPMPKKLVKAIVTAIPTKILFPKLIITSLLNTEYNCLDEKAIYFGQ